MVGLRNGIAYETDDLDVVLKEENARGLKIVLLVIHSEVVDKDGKLLRGILVHFHRGIMNRASDWLEMSTGIKFNLNFEGLGYSVRAMNRQSALEIIGKLEERLAKFRRYYSGLPLLVNPDFPYAAYVLASFLFGLLLYFLVIFWSGRLPTIRIYYEDVWQRFIYPEATVTLATMVLAALLFFVILGAFIELAVRGLRWLIPPSIIAIGDEATIYRKQLKIHEYIFWTVIVGGLVAIVAGIFVATVTK